MISNFADILNGMVICFSRFKDAFDTYMINISFILHILQKIHNDTHVFKFNLTESCKSPNNRQLWRWYHTSLWWVILYNIEWFENKIHLVRFCLFTVYFLIKLIICYVRKIVITNFRCICKLTLKVNSWMLKGLIVIGTYCQPSKRPTIGYFWYDKMIKDDKISMALLQLLNDEKSLKYPLYILKWFLRYLWISCQAWMNPS